MCTLKSLTVLVPPGFRDTTPAARLAHGAHGYPEVPMKAIQAAYRGGCDPLRLVDIPQPQPRDGHALVCVTSAGVTPLDHSALEQQQ
jgi:hypothetical protein